MGQVFVRLVEMHGIDANAIVRDAGIDPATMRDPDARISSDMWDRLLARGGALGSEPGFGLLAARISSDMWDGLLARAAALIPDPAFALRAARCWHPSNMGALGHAWLTSSTLRTGLQRLQRLTPPLSSCPWSCTWAA